MEEDQLDSRLETITQPFWVPNMRKSSFPNRQSSVINNTLFPVSPASIPVNQKPSSKKFPLLDYKTKYLEICNKSVYHSESHEYNIRFYDCSKIPKFKDVLTVILLTKGWNKERTIFVVDKLLGTYHFKVHIAIFDDSIINFGNHSKNVITYQFSELDTTGAALKKIIHEIETPYTFITNSLSHFNNESSSLERLIATLENTKGVAVAAGSFRDPMGVWNHGCLQSEIKNYYLLYNKGYLYSKEGCMFCDNVLGPFITKTSLLKSVEFNANLDGDIVFYDWFLKIQRERKEVISCLEVMFYTNNTNPVSRRDFRLLAKAWKLQDIKTHENKSYHFTCPEVKINCFFIRSKIAFFLVPPCCLEARTKELEDVINCANSLNLSYTLFSGSLIGPAKLDDFLLWDFDNDIIIDCKEREKWLNEGRLCLMKKKCGLSIITKTYFVAKCPLTDIDIACFNNLTGSLPIEYHSIPTAIEARGRRWNVKTNPGMHCLKYYGEDYLKHVRHWRHKNGRKSGYWLPCKNPDNHFCLDQLPTDGNLQLKRPFPLIIEEPIYC